MKIGFDFRMGGSINAGIGRYSFELLQALLRQNQQHEFVVFYNEFNVNIRDLEVLQKLKVQLVKANFRHYSYSEQFAYPKLLNSYGLDLMHFPNFNVPIFYKGDYVVTIHDMVHHKISGHKKSRYYKFLAYKFIINRAAQKALKIITITEAAKKEIIEFLSVPADKVEVIYEAPPEQIEEASDFSELKKAYLLNKPYLLFVGSLERKKNVIKLCQGFDILLDKYKYDLDLVIAGKVDPHYPEIRTQALAIKHHDNLVFTGYVTNSDQITLYKNAFAFVTASLHEGFGLPGVEAMQYGIPVLAANTEVFNEVYDNAAIFFDGSDPADIAEKIHLLISDQPFYESMQKKSVERASIFSWQKAAKQTLELYRNLKSVSYAPEQE